MYELIQIGSKVIIIAVILIIAIFTSYKVWKADLDINKLLNPRRAVEQSVDNKLSWLPTRETEAIYQNDNIVARIKGEKINLEDGIIEFDEIYQSNTLDLGSEFEFQKWKLRLFQAESMIGLNPSRSQDGRIIQKAKCKIAGERRP